MPHCCNGHSHLRGPTFNRLHNIPSISIFLKSECVLKNFKKSFQQLYFYITLYTASKNLLALNLNTIESKYMYHSLYGGHSMIKWHSSSIFIIWLLMTSHRKVSLHTCTLEAQYISKTRISAIMQDSEKQNKCINKSVHKLPVGFKIESIFIITYHM